MTLTGVKLANEIERWANEEILGQATRQFHFDEIVTRIEEYASQLLFQKVKLVNPRMDGGILRSDGFLLVRPVTEIRVLGFIRKEGFAPMTQEEIDDMAADGR